MTYHILIFLQKKQGMTGLTSLQYGKWLSYPVIPWTYVQAEMFFIENRTGQPPEPPEEAILENDINVETFNFCYTTPRKTIPTHLKMYLLSTNGDFPSIAP